MTTFNTTVSSNISSADRTQFQPKNLKEVNLMFSEKNKIYMTSCYAGHFVL